MTRKTKKNDIPNARLRRRYSNNVENIKNDISIPNEPPAVEKKPIENLESNKSPETPHLARWEIILVLISVLFSAASLWISIRSDRASSTPNVQVQSVDGHRSHEEIDGGDETKGEKISINSRVSLENVGHAHVQIVNIRWEPIVMGDPITTAEQWLAVSDWYDPEASDKHDFFYQRRKNPVLALRNATILAGGSKNLIIYFQGVSRLSKGQDTPNIKVTFVFSNGQEITILPEIRYSGVTVNIPS